MYRFNANIEQIETGFHAGKFEVVSAQTGNRLGIFDTYELAVTYMKGAA